MADRRNRQETSPYLMFVENDQSALVTHLKKLKRNVCAYNAPFGEHCDCKYGEPGSGEATGCAELTMVIAGIEKMTPFQYHRFAKAWGVPVDNA